VLQIEGCASETKEDINTILNKAKNEIEPTHNDNVLRPLERPL